MKAKIREILEECIELGIERGHMNAHKHHPDPPYNHVFSKIEEAIWLEIDERFDFERNVCNEVVEGFDELEHTRVESYIGRLIEAKLKEKNT